jgi:O-methyltransferase involved in polyketide biosynthesis
MRVEVLRIIWTTGQNLQNHGMIGYHRLHGDHIVLAGTRAQVTTRSRYTERRLAELASQGLTQYVILGAGLDTFAYRSPLTGKLRVFEVDPPVTQRRSAASRG